jgi:hypothetical protein
VSTQLRVEVRVRGRLAGDLLALVDDLDPRAVPRHTVLTVGGDGRGDGPDAACLTRLLTGLHRAGVELERVLPRGGPVGRTGCEGAGDG